LPAVSGSAGISVLFRAGRRNDSNSLNDHLVKRIGALLAYVFIAAFVIMGLISAFNIYRMLFSARAGRSPIRHWWQRTVTQL